MKRLFAISGLCLFLFSACSPKLSPDKTWANQHWVLTEMKAVPVQLSGTRRDAYIEFIPEEKQITGNGGCNRINGSYTLSKKNKISFGEMISTKMMCNDINFETSFLATLKIITHYRMDGNMLALGTENETLLKFEPRDIRK